MYLNVKMNNKKMMIIISLLSIILFTIFIKKTYSLNNDLILSSIYKIDNDIVYNITPHTTTESLLSIFDYDNKKIFDSNGTEVTNNDIVKTGYKLLLNNNEEYILSVIGDVLGNGTISIDSVKKIASHIIDGNILTTNELLHSADINGDSEIKINDIIVFLKLFLSNTSNKPLNIKITDNEVNLLPAETKQLTVIHEPNSIENINIIWSSSNEKVATVDQNGIVSAKSSGEAIITAKTENGIMDKCKVIVGVALEDISIGEEEITLNPGDTYQINTTFYPSNATNKSLSYSSSNKERAFVNQNGEIKAYMGGIVTITVKASNNIQKQIKITIKLNTEIIQLKEEDYLFRVPVNTTSDNINISNGQGFTVTPEYYIACTISPSNEYGALNLYDRQTNSKVKTIVTKNTLRHCNSLTYNPYTDKLIFNSAPRIGTISMQKIKDIQVGDETILSKDDLEVEYVGDENGSFTDTTGFNNSAVEYDMTNKKYYIFRKRNLASGDANRMRVFVFTENNLSYPSEEKSSKIIDVVMPGSQALGSYKGKILYPHYNKKIAETDGDEYSFRNGLDVYDSETGKYIKSYHLILPNADINKYGKNPEIEEIVWSGEGKTFYIYYGLRYVFKVELDIPEN